MFAALAVVSVAMQLADGCIKLYGFWTSVRDAPGDVAVIIDDLMLLSTVLQDIAKDDQLAPAVSVGLACCQTKLLVNSSILFLLKQLD
jgi:hypothetical protein